MKFKMVLPVILSCVLLTGCWDKVEIDRLNFISTIAIDPGEDIGKEKELKSINPEEPFAEGQIKKINVTYGFPDMSMIEVQGKVEVQRKNILIHRLTLWKMLPQKLWLKVVETYIWDILSYLY